MRQTEQVNVMVTLWLVLVVSGSNTDKDITVLRVAFIGLQNPSNQMLEKKLS